MVCGRIQIHTINKELIKEVLHIKFKGKMHKVNVVEEAKDIINWEIQEVPMYNFAEYNKRNKDEEDMQVDGGKGDGMEESCNENNESSDDEEDHEPIGKEDSNNRPARESGCNSNRKMESDRSSFLRETRVINTFNGEDACSKEKSVGRNKSTHEDGIRKELEAKSK